jgi:hypothetical protein
VQAVRSDPPTPRARAAARAAQRLEHERVARAKERRISWREHREQHSEEYQLREQQDSPLRRRRCGHHRTRRRRGAAGGVPLERWIPPAPSPRATEAAVELAPVVGAEASATGLFVEEPASAVGARRCPLNP